MTADRWQQVDKILEQALEQERDRRKSFLDEACRGDDALRQEVESLLAAHERAGSLLNSAAVGMSRGIYFFTEADEKGYADLNLYEFARGKTRNIRTMERPVDYFAVSPDGRTILYTQLDEEASDLMLVENFH